MPSVSVPLIYSNQAYKLMTSSKIEKEEQRMSSDKVIKRVADAETMCNY